MKDGGQEQAEEEALTADGGGEGWTDLGRPEWVWGRVGLREKGRPHSDAGQQPHRCVFAQFKLPPS